MCVCCIHVGRFLTEETLTCILATKADHHCVEPPGLRHHMTRAPTQHQKGTLILTTAHINPKLQKPLTTELPGLTQVACLTSRLGGLGSGT